MTRPPVYHLSLVPPSRAEADLGDGALQVPVAIDLCPDGSVAIVVGQCGDAGPPPPTPALLVMAYPNRTATSSSSSSLPPASATVLKGHGNATATEAALAAARRLAQKFRRPIRLSYPEAPVPAPDEQTFSHLEGALGRQLRSLLSPPTE